MCLISPNNCPNPSRISKVTGKELPCITCMANEYRWHKKLQVDPHAVETRVNQLNKWSDRMRFFSFKPRGKKYGRQIRQALSKRT